MLPNNTFTNQAFSMPTLTAPVVIFQNMYERGKGDKKVECETLEILCV